MIFRRRGITLVKSLIGILMISSSYASCSSDECSEKGIPDKILYHSPEELKIFLEDINAAFPEITYLEPAGTSAEGRTIYALAVSDKPLEAEPEPKVRITGAIHGDENATTEVIIRMIDYLTRNYSVDASIKNLVDSRYIVFIPMLNPDGVVADSRYNANNVDLNRNFSTAWQSGNDHGSASFSEPESQSIRDYSAFLGFHLSITFHTGEVIVNMPFDYGSLHFGITPVEYSLVTYLGELYSTSGRFLESEGILDTLYVNNGTINGGDWYVINGSLQDWSYVETGCVDYTIEISDDKKPGAIEAIDNLFDLNRDSILAFIEAAGIGVYGRVKNTANSPLQAEITIKEGTTEGDIVTHADSAGYYHRVLLPGNYTITFIAAGYSDLPKSITISEGSQLLLDIEMTP